MKPGIVSALLLLLQCPVAMAHVYQVGNLEIMHPAIMVPSQNSDCSCAHVKIINHGSQAESFLGAKISAAARTHLVEIASGGQGLSTPARVEIPPGKTLDLSRHHWCLFMSGINTSLEADMGAIKGQLLFEKAGAVEIEFMIDAR
jgi:periplasmic copper chaperone A